MTGASYGAGDSFAGALTWYLAACHLDIEAACARAAEHGAAVLRGVNPIANQMRLDDPTAGARSLRLDGIAPALEQLAAAGVLHFVHVRRDAFEDRPGRGWRR